MAVVGAGYAGLAAAVTLADSGARVTVFEAAREPGGRARRIRARGLACDNGVHILLGAYRTLRALLARVGVAEEQAFLRRPLELRRTDGFLLRTGGPLGALGGLLAARGLSGAERWRALLFLARLRHSAGAPRRGETVAALLARHRQPARLRDRLWVPLCLATLNTPPEHACARVFATVLRESLGGGGAASELLFPRTDLSRLFPEPALRWLAARGTRVHLGVRVRMLEEVRAAHDAVIVAVAPQHLAALVPHAGAAFAFRPITTVYLHYAHPLRLPFPMLGLAGSPAQWVFDRQALAGEAGGLACVASASDALLGLPGAEVARRTDAQLRAELGPLPPLLSHRVITEKRATIECAPDRPLVDPLRHAPRLVLAGDYLDPDRPATLETAARSGVRAAAAVLSL